jgi:CRISPR/Cas system CMR-associated protein Cmr1 (group 7 of RAMP superfamily)
VLLAATSTIDVVAVAAAAVAIVALVGCIWLALTLRSLRASQRTVLGEREATDVVEYAVRLEGELIVLRDYLDDAAARLDSRLRRAERRLDGAISHRALVRYDAYGEMSGRQSLSLALLDASRSGVVLSSILHRDQARIYAKQVRDGESELKLSPEEEEALRLALAQDS